MRRLSWSFYYMVSDDIATQGSNTSTAMVLISLPGILRCQLRNGYICHMPPFLPSSVALDSINRVALSHEWVSWIIKLEPSMAMKRDVFIYDNLTSTPPYIYLVKGCQEQMYQFSLETSADIKALHKHGGWTAFHCMYYNRRPPTYNILRPRKMQFCRRHFQMHVLECRLASIKFHLNSFPMVQSPIASIGLDYGLVLNRREATDGLVYWQHLYHSASAS